MTALQQDWTLPLPYYPAFERFAATNEAAANYAQEFGALVESLRDEYGPDAEIEAARAFADLCDLVLEQDGSFISVEEVNYRAFCAWLAEERQLAAESGVEDTR